MITKEPRMEYKDVFAALFFSIGVILFLVTIHLLRINSDGYTFEVLNTTFVISLSIFSGLGIIAIAFVMIHLLKWLVWSATTPKWLKEQRK